MKAPLTLAAALLAITAAPAAAQDADDGDYANASYNRIMASVSAFMDGLAARDADAMRAAVIDGGTLVVVRQDDAGNQVRVMAMDDTIAALAAMPAAAREVLDGAYPNSNGPVGTVWAPYVFYDGDGLHHCGVNVFTLVEQHGDWRIASITYSHLEDGCVEPANL